MSGITPKKGTFKDIRAQAPECLLGVPDETPVVLLTIPFGEVMWSYDGIANKLSNDYKGYTGIVINGVAELYDLSSYDQNVAYRPIRLLTQSKIFGEFSLLDDCIFKTQTIQKYHHNARPGERWQLISGQRCYLLKQRFDTTARAELFKLDPTHDDGSDDHKTPAKMGDYELFYLLKKFSTKMQQTEIALIDLRQLIQKDETLRLKFLEHGWERVKIYRDCLNSFNLSHLLEVRNAALKTAKRLSKVSATSTKWAAIVPIFSDAIFDALNSPLRNEPTFQNITHDLPTEVIKQLKTWGIQEAKANILSASLEHNGEFYIPLGIHNYLINLYANDSHIADDINSVFGKNFPSDKTKPAEQKIKNNPREFYIALANKLIESFLTSHEHYPWMVKCISVDGINRPMLLMHFTVK